MPAGDAKNPNPWDFRKLTDDDFDELVYLVAHLDDPRVEKLRAPDGGLDTVRPLVDDRSRADWGIQAKRHREHIHYKDCEESLDRAVRIWQPDRVTFAFPRNVTRSQHSKLVQRLQGRHAGVYVDWWGAAKLTALILAGGTQGKAIVKKFYHEEDPADLVDRASRAGGPLRTADDLLEREFATGDFLATADPHFIWATSKAPRSSPETPPAPGTLMRLEFSRGDHRLTADAIPRNPSAAGSFAPMGNAVFADPEASKNAQRLIKAVTTSGGRADLGHATIQLDHIPAPFDGLIRELQGSVSIRAVAEPPPWPALMQVDTDEGNAEIEMELNAQPPEDEWDALLVGQRHGLTVEIRFVWSHSDAAGRASLTWRFTQARGSAAQRANVLAFLIALHGKGEFTVADVEHHRPELRQATESRPVPWDIRASQRLYEDWARIERFNGQPLGPPPDDFTVDDLNHLAWVANAVEAGGSDINFENARIVCASAVLAQIKASAGNNIEVTHTLVMNLFGREIPVAKQHMKLPPVRVMRAVRQPGSEDSWEAILVPLAGNSVHVPTTLSPLTSR